VSRPGRVLVDRGGTVSLFALLPSLILAFPVYAQDRAWLNWDEVPKESRVLTDLPPICMDFIARKHRETRYLEYINLLSLKILC